MTRGLTLLVAIVLAALTVSSGAAARSAPAPPPGMVRGYLYRVGPQGPMPAPGITVRLRHPRYGVSAQAQTAGGAQKDGGGMYYFYNVAPGDYALDVVVSAKEIYQLTIVRVPNQPITDVPPIAVR